jgi:hypothetical protein
MTNAVAATSTAVTTGETHRPHGARSAGTSYAHVQAAAAKDADTKRTSGDTTTSSSKSSSDAPKGERTQAVAGHSYKEIVSGPRNGMFINNTGNNRDGEAFLIVKRHGREFHIYGTGEDRTVYEVGRRREANADSGAASTGTTSTGTTSNGTTSAGATETTSTTAATGA